MPGFNCAPPTADGDSRLIGSLDFQIPKSHPTPQKFIDQSAIINHLKAALSESLSKYRKPINFDIPDESESAELDTSLPRVSVVVGDITEVNADGLIASDTSHINFPPSNLERSIMRASGGGLFDKSIKHDGNSTVAIAFGGNPESRPFTALVLVEDLLDKPLSNIVFDALSVSDNYGFRSVTLPTIRAGTLMGAVEKTAEDALREMVGGIRNFMASSKNIKRITIVINDDHRAQELVATLKKIVEQQ